MQAAQGLKNDRETGCGNSGTSLLGGAVMTSRQINRAGCQHIFTKGSPTTSPGEGADSGFRSFHLSKQAPQPTCFSEQVWSRRHLGRGESVHTNPGLQSQPWWQLPGPQETKPALPNGDSGICFVLNKRKQWLATPACVLRPWLLTSSLEPK